MLTAETLRFMFGFVNFGSKDKHPYNNVMFFDGDNIITNENQGYVTLLATERISELYIRMYITVQSG